MVYWGKVMQADSSLGQKMACALDSTEKPLMLDQESSMQAIEYPISKSSIECVRKLVGEETQKVHSTSTRFAISCICL